MKEQDARAEAFAEEWQRLRTAPRPARVGDRDWAIFCAYMHDRRTQRDIAAEYPVSTSRIGQIVKKARDIILSSNR